MKSTKLTIILVVSMFLLGCASGAKMENMVYQGDKKNYDKNLTDSVAVASVSGGQKTNPAWTSEIDDAAFSGAVKQSLLEQGLLSETGKYELRVTMIKVDQPLFGLDLTVTTHVKYTLTNAESGVVIMDEVVIAPHTATVGDAFAAIKRLRLANEGSGKKNIEGMLEKLAKLKINPKEISMVQ